MDKEFMAQEAKRLKADPVFTEVLRLIRVETVEKLLKTPADDTHNIITLQTMAKVCDQFPDILESAIKSAAEKKPLKVV